MASKIESALRLAAFCGALFAGPVALLAAPVALVTDIEGSAEPAVEAFSEIEAGTKIALGSDTRLSFIDYMSCKSVTVVGGTLLFTEQRFLLRKGKIIESKRTRCPKVVRLDQDTQVAGVVLRAGNSALRLKTRPRFVFTGPGRGSIDQVRVRKGEEIILQAIVRGFRFDWPESAADLPKESQFVLEILTKDSATAKRVPFKTTAAGKAELTIIRMN